MMPDSIHAQSDVKINDSCNNCCCFKWGRSKPNENTKLKVERQSPVMDLSKSTEESRPVTEHKVSHIKIDITQEDDIQFVKAYLFLPSVCSNHVIDSYHDHSANRSYADA